MNDPQRGLESAERLYGEGRFGQAESALRRVLRRSPAPVEVILLLAKVLMESGKPRQAVFELERTLSERPGSEPLRMMLHNAYIGCGEPERARAVAEAVFEDSGHAAEAAGAVASIHMSQGRLGEAERWYSKALEADRESLKAELGLARVLSGSLRGPEALKRLRRGRTVPNATVARLLAFQMHYLSGISVAEQFEAQCLAGRLAAREADGYPPRLGNQRDPGRKLTLGYLSPDFRQHACSHFIEPLLAERERRSFRVIAYSGVDQPDATTQRLRSLVDEWRDVSMLSDAALAARIAADGVDVAIDLAGHTSGSRLACLALRPAPITVTYLGYPGTTGTPGIDVRIVDAITDPPGAEAFATERLVRLDGCFLCFRPLQGAPEVGPPPCLTTGHITFGSFNILDKVSEATLDAWAGALRQAPGSRLLVKARSLADAGVRSRLGAAFEARGVAPERVESMAWTESLVDHLAAYARVDIALDTIPYNGTTTTCEALWMGVPVVSVLGSTHAGRVGASLLHAAGLQHLVAPDSESMGRLAGSLGNDRERLRVLRSGLREQMARSALRDERGFVGRFEGALRDLWRQWCSGPTPAA